MNRDCYIDIDILEEKGIFMVNFAHYEIKRKIDLLLEIKTKFVWQGLAFDSYMAKYNEKINKLYELYNFVDKFGKIMIYTGRHYGTALDELKNNWEQFEEELDQELQLNIAKNAG